jgi:hypothetical protein
MIVTIFLLVLILAGRSESTYASTLTVTNTNDSGPGSLRQAIADAAPDDAIAFDVVLAGQTISLTTGELFIDKDLSISGPSGGITVSGSNASTVFEIGDATVTLNQLTISNGHALDGGGIVNNGDLTLFKSTVSKNIAFRGGGIFNGGTLTVSYSALRDNSGVLGGGLFGGGEINIVDSTIDNNTVDTPLQAGNGGGIFSSGDLSIIRTTISNNKAQMGGGIIAGNLTLEDSVVSGNTAVQVGGVMSSALTLTRSQVSFNTASDVGGVFTTGEGTITDSTISANSAGSGAGGGLVNIGALSVLNSTISHNSGRLGAGIANGSGTLTLTNSTLTGNHGGLGPALLNQATSNLVSVTVTLNGADLSDAAIRSESGGVAHLTNSVIANQTSGADCVTVYAGLIDSQGYNLDSDGTCHLTATGDLSNIDPILASLALNPPGTTETHALVSGSPAIDHIPMGVNGCGTTVSTDQRGVSRPRGYGCDIGAFEVEVGPTARDQCKHEGWMQFTAPIFKNEGQCIKFVVSGKH